VVKISTSALKTNMFRVFLISICLFSTLGLQAQTEVLTNADVVELSRSGLAQAVILRKIGTSRTNFDVTAKALIELKAAGVNDDVIAFMMDATEAVRTWSSSDRVNVATAQAPDTNAQSFSDSDTTPNDVKSKPPRPRTISFEKSSIHPSRQALEKELLKRKDFRDLNLTILRYKEEADLYAEIGFVSGSWVTHRYVYRIYDRRSGAVLTAGETTSWGSLAENLARHISKRLTATLEK